MAKKKTTKSSSVKIQDLKPSKNDAIKGGTHKRAAKLT
jgi:hypothetical protein